VFEVLRSPDLETWEPTGPGALTRLDEAWATDYWAPEVAHHDGPYFMYYSAGSADKGHRLRVATAQDPEGPTTGTRTGPAFLKTLPGELTGPCHCSVVPGPDGEDRLAFHAWDEAATRREFHLRRLRWGADGPALAP
jgi:beta-xylosidase